MRDILFRGKRKDNREWVYGYVYRIWERVYILWGMTNDVPNMIEVDPETVGQWTGMYDNTKWEDPTEKEREEFTRNGNFPSEWNGKKIFEGDMVKFKRVNALGYTTTRFGEVKYFDELPIFYIMATTGDAWDWVECEDIEVIGTIHDNPELLQMEG